MSSPDPSSVRTTAQPSACIVWQKPRPFTPKQQLAVCKSRSSPQAKSSIKRRGAGWPKRQEEREKRRRRRVRVLPSFRHLPDICHSSEHPIFFCKCLAQISRRVRGHVVVILHGLDNSVGIQGRASEAARRGRREREKPPLALSMVRANMASSSRGIQIGSAWFQRKIKLRPQHRGIHLVTDEILKEIPELRQFSVGLLHVQSK